MSFSTKKLKECCVIIAGQSPESKYYNTNGDGIPFFQGKADFGDLYPTIRVYCTQPTKIAEENGASTPFSLYLDVLRYKRTRTLFHTARPRLAVGYYSGGSVRSFCIHLIQPPITTAIIK
jgi:hypothetical protein